MSALMAGLNDALRAVLPRRKFGNVLTTLRPSSVEIRVDGPTHRWSVPPSSTPLPAIAWQLGRLRLVLLACASGLIAYTPSGVNTGCVEPWHLLPGVCHMYLSYVLLIMRGCIAVISRRRSPPLALYGILGNCYCTLIAPRFLRAPN